MFIPKADRASNTLRLQGNTAVNSAGGGTSEEETPLPAFFLTNLAS